MPPRRATGPTSREAQGQSRCSVSEEGLAQRGELLPDLVDEVLRSGGLVVERFADALLDVFAVPLQRRLDVTAALAGLALDPVAGLAGFGGRLAAGGMTTALAALDGAAEAGPVGLQLLLGG